jgi:hypothetical protein
MKAKTLLLLPLSALVLCPLASAQTDPATGEQMIEIQITPRDFAAAGTGHHRVHATATLRPDGDRRPSKTFVTDSPGALVEVTGGSQISLQATPAAAAQEGIGAPPFVGPGFYPADLSIVSPTGQVVTQAQVHNVYINCTASCWGNPAIFEKNLFSSRFIHMLDQYVDAEENGRYTVGPSLVINNYPITQQLVTNPLVNYADLDAIIHAAASKLGSGYNHIFNIFLPKGVDYCPAYSAPYTFCFSPDNLATWHECAEHGEDSFPDIPGIELATVEPYPDVFGTDNSGLPLYGCDVGQIPPYSSNTNPTPNGVLVDSVSSFVGHEIFETITDPDGLEWQALNSLAVPPATEIGDLCEDLSFDYTPFYVSGHLYEIQPMYSNKYHACVTVP